MSYTRSMPPCSKLKPRWHPPPRHQMRNSWRASGSILFVKSITLCRQFAILLPNDYNLLNFPLLKDFSDSYTFCVFLLCVLVFGAFVLLAKDQESGRKMPPALLPCLPCWDVQMCVRISLCLHWTCEYRLY